MDTHTGEGLASPRDSATMAETAYANCYTGWCPTRKPDLIGRVRPKLSRSRRLAQQPFNEVRPTGSGAPIGRPQPPVGHRASTMPDLTRRVCLALRRSTIVASTSFNEARSCRPGAVAVLERRHLGLRASTMPDREDRVQHHE